MFISRNTLSCFKIQINLWSAIFDTDLNLLSPYLNQIIII